MWSWAGSVFGVLFVGGMGQSKKVEHTQSSDPSFIGDEPSRTSASISPSEAGLAPGTGAQASAQGLPAQPAALAAKAADTTKDNPWPVRLLSEKIAQYIDRMVPLWVEGQIVQYNKRPGAGMAFLTIRDTDQDMSLPVSIYARALESAGELSEGAHVVAHVKPTFWAKRGTLQLQAKEIAQVGIGDLLARIEKLKSQLASEGLFDVSRKKPLPFLPQTIGLICGRESEALHDVLVNARNRWPEIKFEVREVAVQGVHAVSQVTAALQELDSLDHVEVIVIARGGGAVEDLLPFSNESLVRAAAAATTPIVSAIGHERDTPLLDFVADFRASTPTDAAKRIVPNVLEERAGVDQSIKRIRMAIKSRVDREQNGLDLMRSRPVLSQPHVLVDSHSVEIEQSILRARNAVDRSLLRGASDITALAAQVKALSPYSTLERGYAVVQTDSGVVVRQPDQVALGESLNVRVLGGSLTAQRTD